jgi:hypothetical protein
MAGRTGLEPVLPGLSPTKTQILRSPSCRKIGETLANIETHDRPTRTFASGFQISAFQGRFDGVGLASAIRGRRRGLGSYRVGLVDALVHNCDDGREFSWPRDCHCPIISPSGMPSAASVLGILHPILASTRCDASPLARIAGPTMAL